MCPKEERDSGHQTSSVLVRSTHVISGPGFGIYLGFTGTQKNRSPEGMSGGVLSKVEEKKDDVNSNRKERKFNSLSRNG